MVRTQWHEAKWVAQSLGSTAVAGHSFGALLAARIAAAHPEIAAFVSLGGGFHQLVDSAAELLNSIRTPSFFMFSSSVDPSTASSSSFKPACSAGASGDSRTRSRKSSRRSATMLLIAIAANRLSAVSNCNSSAFVPVLRAL